MRKFIPILAVVMALGSVLRLASAEEPRPAAAGTALSLEEALRRANDVAPQVVLAQYGVREATARRTGAGLRFPGNPRLSGEARPAVTGGSFFGDMGYAAALDVPMDLGGAPGARKREADRGVGVAQAELATVRKQARSEVFAAYIHVVAWARRMEEVDALIAIAERILRASTARADAGASGDVDEASARSELSVLQSQRESATRERDAYLMHLRSLLDMSAGAPLTLTTPLGNPQPPAAENQLVARALNHKPELAQARAQVAALMATSDRLKSELFPRLSVYLGVDAAPVSPIFGQVGLSVELPVAQRNQQARAVTDARTQAEQERLELLLRQVVRDVSGRLAAYESRRRELAVLSDKGLPAAERTLELVETGWLAGRFDIFRVTAAARDVARVRALRTDALESAWLEYIALEFAVGGAPL